MAGKSVDSWLSIPEQLSPLVESEILKYLSGALVGGVIGDLIHDVVSGVIVELIVSTFLVLGMGELVAGFRSGVSPGSSGYYPTPEVVLVGSIGAIIISLVVLWMIVFPKFETWIDEKHRSPLLLKAGLVAVSAGILFGGLFGLAAAIIASSLGGIAVLELDLH